MRRVLQIVAIVMLTVAFSAPAIAGDWVPGGGSGNKVEIVNKKTGERRDVGRDWDKGRKKKSEKDAADEANKEDKATRKAKKKNDKKAEK